MSLPNPKRKDPKGLMLGLNSLSKALTERAPRIQKYPLARMDKQKLTIIPKI